MLGIFAATLELRGVIGLWEVVLHTSSAEWIVEGKEKLFVLVLLVYCTTVYG
jgi:hypothetical protein